MTKITDTAFARLEAEGRLVNPVLKAPTKTAGQFGCQSASKRDPEPAYKKDP